MTPDEVGYIHCSTPEQIEGVAERFYSDLSELLLLEIDPDLIDADIIEEPPAPGVEELFPHIWSTANRRGSQRSTVDQIRNWLATSGSGSGECHRAVRTLLVEGSFVVVASRLLVEAPERPTTNQCTSSGPSARRSARWLAYMRERSPLRHPRAAVNLDSFVNNLAGADRHHCLDGAHPYASLSVSEFVHCLGGCEHQRTIDSISIRAFAMTSGFLPRLAMRSNASVMPRFTMSSSFFGCTN